MRIQIRTPSRAGLAGNPSDGYGGRAVAVALAGLEARVTIEPRPGVRVSSPDAAPLALQSLAGLSDPELLSGRSPHRLAVASWRHFFRWTTDRGLEPVSGDGREGFDLFYETTIPRHVGLAGSSALAIGFLRAFGLRCEVEIPEPELPGMALAVETEWLGIHGGLMDRVSQTMGGVVYMDLAADRLRETGIGRYERLPEAALPALFIAWEPGLAAGSDTVHNPLKERVARGDPEADALLREIAGLADEARAALLSGAPHELAPIMDRNFDLRARLVDVGEGNRKLVETGRKLGAGVKQTGSGGAVVGATDGDPERLIRLRDAYGRIGARFLEPAVWRGPTDGTRVDDAPGGMDRRPGAPGIGISGDA